MFSWTVAMLTRCSGVGSIGIILVDCFGAAWREVVANSRAIRVSFIFLTPLRFSVGVL